MRYFDNSYLPSRQSPAIKRHDVRVCECGSQAWAAGGPTDVIMVSAEDRLLLDMYWWTCITKGHHRYAESPTAGAHIGGLRYLHQNIAIPTKGCLIDHKNGDGLNNMRPNLRDATRTTNGQNSRRRKHASSIFKGVKIDPRPISKRYGARITIDGDVRWLGRYATEEEAARAYDAAAVSAFGEFAKTNFPGG